MLMVGVVVVVVAVLVVQKERLLMVQLRQWAYLEMHLGQLLSHPESLPLEAVVPHLDSEQ